jgi:Rieske Fe-S protein
MSPEEPSPPPTDATPRREFLKSAACMALGTCAVAAPIGAVVVVLAHPLKMRNAALAVKLTTLPSLAIDGPPRFFQVVAERRDAWTKFPASAIGAVFLRRVGEREVVAFNASCPHLGCAVDFQPARDAFYCPCHDSEFAKTGEVRGNSPSLRGLDALRVEVRGENEVWVFFENFKTGIAEKVSTSA